MATQSITLKLDAPSAVARTGERALAMTGSHGVKSCTARLIGLRRSIFVTGHLLVGGVALVVLAVAVEGAIVIAWIPR